MHCSNKKDIEDVLNKIGAKREESLFIINFDATQGYIFPKEKIPSNIKFSFNNEKFDTKNKPLILKKHPIKFEDYEQQFNQIIEEIKNGNTYMLNLTSKTDIELEGSLSDIYNLSDAQFKILWEDKFVCFSPEIFVNIENDEISTHPMKGTIDANIHNAQSELIDNKKELAEHVMVVDLLRNDLSIVASNIQMEKFRYISKVKTDKNDLLQTSSKIKANLENNWQERLGTIITSLLPAGSITGAPKKKTVEIIKNTELYDRDFYTGVFGYFDGESLKSAVMIRFIEKTENGYCYKSGGGITIDSDVKEEYDELIKKVYLAF